MSDETTEDARSPDEIAAESAAEFAELSLDGRCWLKVLLPYVQARTHDADPDPEVQRHSDEMHSAICQRVQRIVESDLPRGVRNG